MLFSSHYKAIEHGHIKMRVQIHTSENNVLTRLKGM